MTATPRRKWIAIKFPFCRMLSRVFHSSRCLPCSSCFSIPVHITFFSFLALSSVAWYALVSSATLTSATTTLATSLDALVAVTCCWSHLALQQHTDADPNHNDEHKCPKDPLKAGIAPAYQSPDKARKNDTANYSTQKLFWYIRKLVKLPSKQRGCCSLWKGNRVQNSWKCSCLERELHIIACLHSAELVSPIAQRWQ